MFEEGLIDFVYLSDGGPDEGLESDLVDDSGEALGEVENKLDGAFGEEFLRSFGPFQMETDIVAGIVDGEGSEGMGKDDALSEGFILGLVEP